MTDFNKALQEAHKAAQHFALSCYAMGLCMGFIFGMVAEIAIRG